MQDTVDNIHDIFFYSSGLDFLSIPWNLGFFFASDSVDIDTSMALDYRSLVSHI